MGAYAILAGLEIGDGFPVRVMGAINVSPESFFAGSVVDTENALQRRAEEMVNAGADMLDVGAASTAPYLTTHISEEEELRRLVSALRVLRSFPVPISADTPRSRVAAAALEEGAAVINDVTGLRGDPAMAPVVARAQGAIFMAREQSPAATDPIQTTADLLIESSFLAQAAGVPKQQIVLDPGIGFFRQAALPWWQWDCEVLRRVSDLRQLLPYPILIGLSRKSFLGKVLDRTDPTDRLAGSLAATAVGVLHGAHMFRTHDVGPTRDAIRVAEALRRA